MSVACLAVVSAAAVSPSKVENALSALDRALEHKNSYIDRRQAALDSMSSLRRVRGDEPSLLMRIADGYTSFNNDSALACLSRGIDVSHGGQALQFRWKHASLLPLAGFFEEAGKEFYSIDPSQVPDSLLISYYDSGRQMHSYMASFYGVYPEIAAGHTRRSLDFQEKLLGLLPKGSAEYKFRQGEYFYLSGNHELARVILSELVDAEPADSHLRARTAHHLSSIAKEYGDSTSYIYYLALSATADVLSATREVLSLQELGTRIYESGDIARAHAYLSHALANAVECGAPLRTIDTSQSLPIIERAHLAHIKQWRKSVYFIMGIMGLLLLVLAATLFALYREIHKQRRLQANLKLANRAKEVYIGRFLQLCSIYMDKLNRLCEIVERKLTAGQADELLRLSKSGKFVEEQSREFFDVFDDAFLHIYPGFVAGVNALLRPECRIVLKPGERLNNDLRIIAVVRLGIDDSARIARVLNYSLNTIYAYRNRLRARAIDRDNFEKDIMTIE